MDGRIITPEELSKAEKFGDFNPVYKVDKHTIVKTGDSVRLAEAEAIRLVRSKTTIPVPKIYNAYTDNDSGHVRIVMEFIEGDSLANLREIKASFIGSVDGSACEDQLFTDEIGGYGPYKDEAAFNQGIITALKNTSTGSWVNTVSDMVRTLKNHDIVMTHGDFSPRNIIVQGSKVVGIVDWEMSGYYPEYWEYVKAMYRPAWESDWIIDRAVQRILEPYSMALAVMMHAQTIVW